MIHGSLVDSRTGDLELRLELYHRCELQLGYQQSITEILLWRTQTSGLPTIRKLSLVPFAPWLEGSKASLGSPDKVSSKKLSGIRCH